MLSLQLQPLQQNSGLFYDQLGQVKIQRSHYDLITHIDLNKIDAQLSDLQDILHDIKNICSNFNCGPQLLTISDVSFKIADEYKSLVEKFSRKNENPLISDWNEVKRIYK